MYLYIYMYLYIHFNFIVLCSFKLSLLLYTHFTWVSLDVWYFHYSYDVVQAKISQGTSLSRVRSISTYLGYVSTAKMPILD